MLTDIYSFLASVTLPLAFSIHIYIYVYTHTHTHTPPPTGGGEKAFELSYCHVLSHTSSHFIWNLQVTKSFLLTARNDNRFIFNKLIIAACYRKVVQQKMKLCSSPSVDESCDNCCYPSSTCGNLRYFKSHTDATSNCTMKENFLQDFPGESLWSRIYIVLNCMAYLYNKFYALCNIWFTRMSHHKY
jgi:hypothetical protein